MIIFLIKKLFVYRRNNRIGVSKYLRKCTYILFSEDKQSSKICGFWNLQAQVLAIADSFFSRTHSTTM